MLELEVVRAAEAVGLPVGIELTELTTKALNKNLSVARVEMPNKKTRCVREITVPRLGSKGQSQNNKVSEVLV